MRKINFPTLSQKRIIQILFVASLLTHLVFSTMIVLFYGDSMYMDDWEYYSYARELIIQGPLLKHPELIYGQGRVGPGLPFVVSICMRILNQNFHLILIFLNCISISTSIVFIYKFSSEFINVRVAILSSIWALLYFEFFRYTPAILKENWLIMLIIMCVYYFSKFLIERRINKYFFLFGLGFLTLIHFDERYLSFLIPIVAIIIVEYRSNIIHGLQVLAFIILLVCLGMLPWTIRNYIVYDQLVILSPRTQIFTSKILTQSPIDITNNYDRHPLVLNGEISAYQLRKRDNKTAINNKCRTVDYLKGFLSPIMVKGIYVTPKKYTKWSAKHNFISFIQYGMLLPFFLLSIPLAVKFRNKFILCMIAIVIFHICLHVFILNTGIQRYRIPIDSLIIISSAWSLQLIITRIRKSR